MDPEGLKHKPFLPWYHKIFLDHYHVLANSRTYRVDVTADSQGFPVYSTKPNPIDILTILRYNREVVKMKDPADFIYLMQSLDAKFLSAKKG